jgi:N-carbamoyl-L-amino-acid hydrolase
MRTLNDLDYQTEAPLEVAAWTNEEGSRFPAPMIGSAVFAGISELADGLGLQDLEGNSLGDELERIGYAGPAAVGGRPVGAYFEAHIEQGPILEAEGRVIGVVGGVQGLRWYEITLHGQDAHAGPTPMPSRRDALLGAAQIVAAVNRIGHEHLPGACATVGLMQVHPNSRNVIPGRVFMSVDLRHPEAEILEAMGAALRTASEAAAADCSLELEFAETHQTPAVVFDPACVSAVREGAEAAGYAHQDIISGAGHDACCMAEVAPTGMIFVPCAGGISHNEEESATAADLEAGCNVLLQAMLASA